MRLLRPITKELRDMIKSIKDVLQETPPELAADIIDQGIILTGGTALCAICQSLSSAAQASRPSWQKSRSSAWRRGQV